MIEHVLIQTNRKKDFVVPWVILLGTKSSVSYNSKRSCFEWFIQKIECGGSTFLRGRKIKYCKNPSIWLRFLKDFNRLLLKYSLI